MNDLSRMAINQATTVERWNLREAIEGYARGGVRRIGIWREKLAECGLAEAQRLLSDNGMKVADLNRAGPLFGLGREATPSSPDDDRRAIDEAAALGAECLIVFPGMTPGTKSLENARAKTRDRIASLLPEAQKVGVTLAIEPLHPMLAADRSPVNTLAQANALCDAVGEGLGILLDVYHSWWDPDLEREIFRAGSRLVGLHVADWRVPTRDLGRDRAMMGDGVIDIRRIREWVDAAGYRGSIGVEIFSRDWWQRDPDEVTRIAVQRYLAYV